MCVMGLCISNEPSVLALYSVAAGFELSVRLSMFNLLLTMG